MVVRTTVRGARLKSLLVEYRSESAARTAYAAAKKMMSTHAMVAAEVALVHRGRNGRWYSEAEEVYFTERGRTLRAREPD
jgi:hypothetical protein